MDIPGPNQRPPHIGFKSQEGDCRLQKGHWAHRRDGGSVDYCEEAFDFLESCSIEDEGYFAALIRMYGRSLELVSSLPPAERSSYLDRLGRLRSRGRNVGWGVEEEFNSSWYGSALDEHDGD
jgi:hypothetical protein